MIENPTPERPLLVGLLIDVSGSMTSSIDNVSGQTENRLQSFQNALGDLAAKAQKLSSKDSGELLKLFAYGFGFGNLLGAIFGGASSPPVRDLLEGASSASSTVGINRLSKDWEQYKAHVEGLAIKMFGATPMLEGVDSVYKRFKKEERRQDYCGKILFILSDGDPTDATPNEVVASINKLKDADTLVVSCYVTDHNITEPRYLYGTTQPTWPQGANLMFDVASKVPKGTSFYSFLKEHHWAIEEEARLFTQINQSEVLKEFLEVLISPIVNQEKKNNKSVFVSYSHKDAHWLERLEIHLKPLVRSGQLELWHDQKIQSGHLWKSEIDKALDNSSVAILLISADFIASDFIASEELPILLEKAEKNGTKIIPVIVSPSRFEESALSCFQSSNQPNKPLSMLSKQEAEAALVKVSRDVESAL
ncbi:MAG: TIR domain-containing protein [Deltaproteobacteria bacterium]|nr:TIR domain-containing protein [Deltaproteobacteria bacterium]